MKSTKDIAKAIAELQKLQLAIEVIEQEMTSAEDLDTVENTNWEERMDKAYEKTTAVVEKALEKGYEKDWARLLGIYEKAEANLPAFL